MISKQTLTYISETLTILEPNTSVLLWCEGDFLVISGNWEKQFRFWGLKPTTDTLNIWLSKQKRINLFIKDTINIPIDFKSTDLVLTPNYFYHDGWMY